MEPTLGGYEAQTANQLMLRKAAGQRASYPRRQLETTQDALDLGAGLLNFVPILGDAANFAADFHRYSVDPSSRSWLNFGLTGLGLLPFVPGMTMVKKTTPDYSGSHRPPSPVYGAPLHDLTAGDLIPADIYSNKAARFYGTGDAALDAETLRLFHALRNAPGKEVSVYRAVPKDAPDVINPGDWVTINKNYAAVHGEGPLRGDYKIVERKVRADEVWTSLDSIHEFGYHPKK